MNSLFANIIPFHAILHYPSVIHSLGAGISTQTSCRAHPASYSVGIWSKVAQAWR